jgi:hypothetical protein
MSAQSHVTPAGGLTIAFLLLNEARHRIVQSTFGISRRDSNIVTAALLGVTVVGAERKAARMRAVRIRPSLASTAIGAAVLKEGAHTVAGDWSRTSPFFGRMIAAVLLEKSFGPSLRMALHSGRASLHAVAVSLRSIRRLVEGE